MRVADLCITIGSLPSGPTASVIDVPGVGVGHATVVYDESAPPAGRGIARTGVTVLDPGGNCLADPVPAGVSLLNGAGELTCRSQIDEWGFAETPVFLTSTMQVGRVYDAACQLLVGGPSTFGEVFIPVVGECDDSWVCDPRSMHVTFDDVRRALEQARAGGEFDQGAVGAGTGMSCLGWKGGIGSASRVLPDGHVVGVLLLTNFGNAARLTIDGVPVGEHLGRGGIEEPPRAGSCIGIVITDAPIDSAGCTRLARRIGLGLARAGSVAHHGSGEIFLGLANGLRQSGCGGPAITGRALDIYFEATVDTAEEAVIASMINATTTTGYQGRTLHALPLDEVRAILGRHR
ncbi:MAG: P1 family peptidase [Actinobacteria bacterium]|nr:P1 family peptidase [Actinomycetota bacterium]